MQCFSRDKIFITGIFLSIFIPEKKCYNKIVKNK